MWLNHTVTYKWGNNARQYWYFFILTKFSVSDAHVALQEVVHFLYRLLLKFCRLENTNNSISASIIQFLSFTALGCCTVLQHKTVQTFIKISVRQRFIIPLMRGTKSKRGLGEKRQLPRSLPNSVNSSMSTGAMSWECASPTDSCTL